jgi:SAM-dependent methyltransferase
VSYTATVAEERQREHFDAMADHYEAHYSDPLSQRYRNEFIDAPMLDGIDLQGKRVLEAMCGSGQTTAFLKARGAEVVGLDISENSIASFRRNWPECEAVQASLLSTGLETGSFDCIVVTGGLHHLHPNMHEGIAEAARLLKPGGTLCCFEPHTGSIANLFRKIWYRLDPIFEDNEHAIDLDEIGRRHAAQFAYTKIHYFGNVALMLVLNSMVLRIPLALKRIYAPFVMAIERALSIFHSRRFSCVVVFQLRKK